MPASPSFDYLARHWSRAVDGLGLRVRFTLTKAGFYPPGGGELRAEVAPWPRPATLRLEERGELLEVRGISGASRLKGNVAERQRDAAQSRLWEERRLEPIWDVVSPPAASPGSFLLLEAIFDKGRAAFGFLGERGTRAESLGDRAARRLLRFLESEGAVDPHLADQLAVPIALGRGGGLVTTCEVTRHLETAAATLRLFGVRGPDLRPAGRAGGLEVGSC